MNINKTLYQLYLVCPEEAWLMYNEPAIATPPSADALFRMEQGNEVDIFAQELFKSKSFLKKLGILDRDIHFQFRVEAEGFVAIADIVAIDEVSKSIDILEVKASANYGKVTSDYTYDAAFQCHVFERAGYTVRKVFILNIDHTFVFEGHPINAKAFFRHPNISVEVHKLLPSVKKDCDALKVLLNEPEPAKQLKYCKNKANCLFFQRHFAYSLPEYSVFDLARITEKTLTPLLQQGILDVQHIPKYVTLTKKQLLQVAIAQENYVHIDHAAIHQKLGDLVYPLYFLDYETVSRVFPLQLGLKPYTQMVFQYSLHILDAPDAKLRHAEYLLNATDEPVTNLLAHLQQHLLADNGSVVVWNKSFEENRNKEMAKHYEAYNHFLSDINHRMFDLMEIFQNSDYQVAAFKGSYSIKKVLPALVPQFSYKNLVIQDGIQAVVTWYNTVTSNQDAADKEKIFNDLKAYCNLDTLAMYEIWAFLNNIQIDKGASY